MKAKFFTLVAILAFTVLSTQSWAAIRRVNNNTGVSGTNVYATLQAAYDAATAGDTLLIEGSNTNYGDLTLTKKLIMIGTGYLLSNNAQTQANLITSKVDDLVFNDGSDGSAIMGCTINSIVITEDNITIARNYISNATPASASINLNGNNSNILIKQNLVYGLINNTANKTPQVVIQNNLLGRIVFTESVPNALIQYNTFWYGYQYTVAVGYGIDVYNSIVTNNIIWHYYYYYSGTYGNMRWDATQGNTITYNYLNEADPGDYEGSNNLFSQAIPFKTASPDGKIDNNFTITAGSAAETAAQGGGQCGMFGGSDPYILSGMPPIPHIYKLESDPAGTNSDPLNVKISVKAQN